MHIIIKNIPNILTAIRIILTPFIIYLSSIDNIKLCIILILIASITDLFDGLIARSFNLVSPFGAKLDTISDKLFAGSLIISLMFKNNLFILCLIGEIFITIINLISFFKGKNPSTKYIGKIKTTILFITISLGFTTLIFPNLIFIINILIITSFIFQILSCFCYLNYYLNFEKIKN